MSTKNEVVTMVNGYGLANSELKKAVVNIKTAEVQGKRSAWVIANEYNKIMSDELFEDDFQSKGEFADFMGVSNGLLSQYNKAVEFIRSQVDRFNPDNTTVGKAYMLSCLDDLKDFIAYCDSEKIVIEELSDNGLKQVIKEYKNIVTVDETETDETETDETETDETEDTEEVNTLEYIKELIADLTPEELKELKAYVKNLK